MPLSETTVPNFALASTLTQGAGVTWYCVVVIMYSRPSGVKPPNPLKKIRSGRSEAGACRAGR
jgi:hypothetical protein